MCCFVRSDITPRPGGALANHHLRQALVFVNVLVMAQPELYLSNAAQHFGPDGKLTSDSTQKFVAGFATLVLAYVGSRFILEVVLHRGLS